MRFFINDFQLAPILSETEFNKPSFNKQLLNEDFNTEDTEKAQRKIRSIRNR
jgi:hypothetical protein